MGNKGGDTKGASSHAPHNLDRCLYKPPSGTQHVRIERTTEDNKRDAEQNRQQTRQGNLAYTLNAITTIAAIFNLIALIFLYESTMTARNQAKTAQQEFESSQRPWVSANFQAGVLHMNPPGIIAIETTGEYNNVGHSVALKVENYIALVPFQVEGKVDCSIIFERFKSFYLDPKVNVGKVIFPNATVHDFPGGSKGAMDANLAETFSGAGAIEMVSCIAYLSPIDQQMHYTRDVYRVYRRGDDGNPADLKMGEQQVILLHSTNGSMAN